MMIWSLFIIGLMGLFFYNKIGSIILKVVLPPTEIIELVFLVPLDEQRWMILLWFSFVRLSQEA